MLVNPLSKKKKNLTELQRKNLKKISRFNKEVLRDNLPDVFLADKIQNNLPLRHESSLPSFLSLRLTSDDKLFIAFLYFFSFFLGYTFFKLLFSIIIQLCFEESSKELIPLFKTRTYIPIFNFFKLPQAVSFTTLSKSTNNDSVLMIELLSIL